MSEEKKKYKVYAATVKFWTPMSGTVQVPAENEEEARKIVLEQNGDHKDVEILSLVDMADIELPRPRRTDLPQAEDKEKLN